MTSILEKFSVFAKENNISLSIQSILGKECLVVKDNKTGQVLAKGVIQAGHKEVQEKLVDNILKSAIENNRVTLSLCFGKYSAPLGTQVYEQNILDKPCLVVRDIFGNESKGVIQAGTDEQRNLLVESVLLKGGFKKVEPTPLAFAA